MGYLEDMNEINMILDNSVGRVVEEWSVDDTVWFTAWMLNEFGEDVLDEEKKEKVTADDAADKMKEFLKPPGFVVDTPFPDTWDMWWESVADLINEGKVMKGGKPNYEGAMTGWKNRVDERYGFRPNRTKEKTMTEMINSMVSGASKIVSSKRRGMTFPKELISTAAKLLSGRNVQKRRKAEYERGKE